MVGVRTLERVSRDDGDGNVGSWKQPLGTGAMLGNETLAMAETKVVKTTGSEAVKEARGQKVGRTLHAYVEMTKN